MDNDDVDMETILKRFALWGGIALAIISIYFSYDGADQTIQGGNPSYTEIAKYIMIVMACVVTLAQFIFNSDFGKLSSTMRVIGLISYVYSLTTNYMGINHLFGFSGFVGGMIAAFMDVAPEAFIAWSLDDSMRGDMLGNIAKFLTGAGSKRRGKKVYSSNSEHPNEPQIRPANTIHNPNKNGKGRSYWENRKKSEMSSDTQPKINRHDLFGE